MPRAPQRASGDAARARTRAVWRPRSRRSSAARASRADASGCSSQSRSSRRSCSCSHRTGLGSPSASSPPARCSAGCCAAGRSSCTVPSTVRSPRWRNERLRRNLGGTARPSRFSLRCGTNFAALLMPVAVFGGRFWPLPATALHAARRSPCWRSALTMELWLLVQGSRRIARVVLLPGLGLQRLTTREPGLDETRVALTALAAVLRREFARAVACGGWPPRDNSIEAHDLVREFKKGPRAVDGIDLRVDPGEIYGFLGPNGAGKSTTVHMLTTLLPPTAGTARVAGYDVVQGGAEGAQGRSAPRCRRRHSIPSSPDASTSGCQTDDARDHRRGARAQERRAADAGRSHRGRRPQGQGLLRWDEAPARPRARARPPPAHPLPRRADDRARHRRAAPRSGWRSDGSRRRRASPSS